MITDKQKERLCGILTTAHDIYRKGLFIYASHKINNCSKSEDLVQETFFKTWKYLVKGGKIDKMKAFLFHVLNDLIIDEYRKHKTVSLDVFIEKGFEPSIDYDKHIINTLDGKIVIFLIKRLPKKYQKIIYMRYVQDLSLDEMSSITKQSKNVIAVQIHRGLKKLKYIYQHIKNRIL